jgi:hypothetical protein
VRREVDELRRVHDLEHLPPFFVAELVGWRGVRAAPSVLSAVRTVLEPALNRPDV